MSTDNSKPEDQNIPNMDPTNNVSADNLNSE